MSDTNTQIPAHIIDFLMSVGSRSILTKNDASSLEGYGWVNRLGIENTKRMARRLSNRELRDLFRGLVIAERELKHWRGGSVAGAIWVFHIYEDRVQDDAASLAVWAQQNTSNHYIPTQCSWFTRTPEGKELAFKSFVESRKAAVELRYIEQKDKLRREGEKLAAHRNRIQNGQTRKKEVVLFNKHMLKLSPHEMLNAFIFSDFPLEAISDEVLEVVGKNLPSLDNESRKELVRRIDRRQQGVWGGISRQITAPNFTI